MRTAPGHLIGSRSRGSGQRVVLVLAGTTPFAPGRTSGLRMRRKRRSRRWSRPSAGHRAMLRDLWSTPAAHRCPK